MYNKYMSEHLKYIGLSKRLIKHLISIRELESTEAIHVLFGTALLDVINYMSSLKPINSICDYLTDKQTEQTDEYTWNILK